MTDWSQIVEQHGPAVWRVAVRLLNHEADAADCFQRTFVSALELSRKEAVRNWPALLKRLVTARAIERLRQRRQDTDRLTSLPPEAADSKAIDPAEAAIAGELADRLREALAEIDPKQAQVLCLACLEGHSYQEIADQLGMPVSSVGVLVNRGRLALRERLQPSAPAAEHFGETQR
jgi:RNA polymerase sigma-70 factor (ECF subfamily)